MDIIKKIAAIILAAALCLGGAALALHWRRKRRG